MSKDAQTAKGTMEERKSLEEQDKTFPITLNLTMATRIDPDLTLVGLRIAAAALGLVW